MKVLGAENRDLYRKDMTENEIQLGLAFAERCIASNYRECLLYP